MKKIAKHSIVAILAATLGLWWFLDYRVVLVP